jgi:hypothetical protein
MTSLAIDDLSQTSANAILMARTSKVISGVMRGNLIDERSQRVVAQAAEFLTRIVEGSLLVEDKQVQGFAPSHENLREYVRALSALQSLKLVSHDDSSAVMFVRYRERLLQLTTGEQVSIEELQKLRRFFGALSSFFFSDLTRPASEDRGDRLPADR